MVVLKVSQCRERKLSETKTWQEADDVKSDVKGILIQLNQRHEEVDEELKHKLEEYRGLDWSKALLGVSLWAAVKNKVTLVWRSEECGTVSTTSARGIGICEWSAAGSLVERRREKRQGWWGKEWARRKKVMLFGRRDATIWGGLVVLDEDKRGLLV